MNVFEMIKIDERVNDYALKNLKLNVQFQDIFFDDKYLDGEECRLSAANFFDNESEILWDKASNGLISKEDYELGWIKIIDAFKKHLHVTRLESRIFH